MELLRNSGAVVEYSDPHVAGFPKMREHHFDLLSVSLNPTVVAGYDCVVLLTDHDRFDFDMIIDNAQLLVDLRGRYREARPNLVKA